MFSVIIKPIKRCSSTIKAIKSMFVSVLTPPYQKNFKIQSLAQANTTCCGSWTNDIGGGGQLLSVQRTVVCGSLLIQGMHVMIAIGNNSNNYRNKETTDLAYFPKIKSCNHELLHVIRFKYQYKSWIISNQRLIKLKQTKRHIHVRLSVFMCLCWLVYIDFNLAKKIL